VSPQTQFIDAGLGDETPPEAGGGSPPAQAGGGTGGTNPIGGGSDGNIIPGDPGDGGSQMASSTAKYIHEGDIVDYTPVADTPAGTIVLQADLIGITLAPIKANVLGSIAVEGVFDFAKAGGAGSAIPAGTLTYWDAANAVATKVATGNKLIGKAVKSTVDADALVRVRLQQ